LLVVVVAGSVMVVVVAQGAIEHLLAQVVAALPQNLC
jgi:hypothetical protein